MNISAQTCSDRPPHLLAQIRFRIAFERNLPKIV